MSYIKTDTIKPIKYRYEFNKPNSNRPDSSRVGTNGTNYSYSYNLFQFSKSDMNGELFGDLGEKRRSSSR